MVARFWSRWKPSREHEEFDVAYTAHGRREVGGAVGRSASEECYEIGLELSGQAVLARRRGQSRISFDVGEVETWAGAIIAREREANHDAR